MSSLVLGENCPALVGLCWCIFFFFNDTATTEIYTLPLHDALPISAAALGLTNVLRMRPPWQRPADAPRRSRDRKSTRLNSSHLGISYAVFCLNKGNDHLRRLQHLSARDRGRAEPSPCRRRILGGGPAASLMGHGGRGLLGGARRYFF